MSRLFYFIYRYRAFFLFIVLEFLSGWLVVINNQYQGALLFNSSNSAVANVLNLTQRVKVHFSLQATNQKIAEENAKLKTILKQRTEGFYSLNAIEVEDTAIINRFRYINAEVVNNSVHRFKNYITINKGTNDGVKSGMAVIGMVGAVGKVKSVSNHYAVVSSLLNTNEYISSTIKSTNNFGTIKWKGADHQHTHLKFIPRHASPSTGDTIVTSGFNAIFPKDILVGVIDDVELPKEAQFYNLRVKLAEDFTRLAFVKVIQSNLKAEKDSLEQSVIAP